MSGSRIEIHSLTKSYLHGETPLTVLRGIDAVIEAGEMVAIVGLSGAGKSTLLHVLGALDSPTTGNVLYDGIDITKLSSSEVAQFRNQAIGFVFQFHHLLPDFTARENCAMPALIAGWERSRALKRADELLERVKLAERRTHRPGELSGGEQQRVALARALYMNPKTLLADEPTGNLDTKTGEEVHSLLLELNRVEEMTIVLVTHNADFAHRLPRRLQMVDGKIVQNLSSGENPGLYATP